MGSPSPRPATVSEQQLCHIYIEQVDPIIKILHRPSLEAFMLNGKPYLGYEPGHIRRSIELRSLLRGRYQHDRKPMSDHVSCRQV